METDDLVFSNSALLSRPYFYDGLNDINLYVEDESTCYLYEAIFKRLLGAEYNIQSIFPCGGKQGVKQAFSERGHSSEGIKNIYVVDGDFDRLLFPEKMIQDPQFVYLKMYNIECYLINEAGICNVVKSKLKCMDAEICQKFHYSEWYRRIVDESKDLFLCHCYVQKCELGIPNVSRNPFDFIDRETGFMRTDGAFEEYLNELSCDHPDVIDEIEAIKLEFEKLYGKHYEAIICGKFLLTSLHSYLCSVFKRSFHKDDVLWSFAITFDVNKLDYVRDACLGVA